MSGTEKHFQNSVTNITSKEGSIVLIPAGSKGILDGVLTGVVGAASTVISFQNSGGDVLFALAGDAVRNLENLNIVVSDGLTVVTSDSTGDPDFSVLHR